MEPTVTVGYGPYTDSKTNTEGIRLELTNVGQCPIESIKVEWAYEFDVPRVVSAKVSEKSGRLTFATSADGPLQVGDTRTFLVPPECLDAIRAVIQAASSDEHSVRLTMDGKEEVGVPGTVWGEFIERRFPASRVFALSEDRIEAVQVLLRRIFDGSLTFKIFPPRELTDEPSLLEAGDIVDRLGDTNWWLRFADGHEEILSLPELIVLTHNLVALKTQFEMQAQADGPGTFKITLQFAVQHLMEPAEIRRHLKMLELEGLPGE